MTLTTQLQSDFTNQLAEVDAMHSASKKLLATKHYDKLGEEGILAVLAQAKAMGIHPIKALNGAFYVVQGKVGMSTEMMAALARQRGHSISKDPKSNNETCILHGKRADTGDTWTCTFNKDDAIAAGLWNGPTWKKYPSVMLYNRCMSMLFRQLFPDLSLGAGYAEDELKEITKTGEYAKADIQITNYEVVTPKEKPKAIEQQVQTISLSQAEELKLLCSSASSEVCKNVKKLFKDMNVSGLKDLPLTSYDYVKDLLMRNQVAEVSAIAADIKVEDAVDE